jgi:3-dehydroquinate synthetase
MFMPSVSCVTDKTYGIRMERGVLAHDSTWLAEAILGRSAVIITTTTVDAIYGESLRSYLECHAISAAIHVADCTEATKTLETASDICRCAQALDVSRRGLLVAFGGGVCSDLVTVAASWIHRGIGHVRIPTTLVGQVDAAVGIKGAVNFEDAKNYLGCYYPPEQVLIDPSFLATLDARALRCGLSEIVKVAIVGDAELFDLVEASYGALLHSRFVNPPEIVDRVLALAIRRMVAELERNIFENVTYQRLVDMGHTFSPLLESESAFSIAHGEAVAIDMALSAAIGLHLDLLDASGFGRIVDLLCAIGLPVWSPLLTPALAQRALARARRHRGGLANLVVPTAIGSAMFLDLPDETALLRAALETVRDVGERASAVFRNGFGVPVRSRPYVSRL